MNATERKIRVTEAAEILNVSPQYIRIGLQQQRLPIGTAVKMSSIWTYNISLKLLEEYAGLGVKEKIGQLRG